MFLLTSLCLWYPLLSACVCFSWFLVDQVRVQAVIVNGSNFSLYLVILLVNEVRSLESSFFFFSLFLSVFNYLCIFFFLSFINNILIINVEVKIQNNENDIYKLFVLICCQQSSSDISYHYIVRRFEGPHKVWKFPLLHGTLMEIAQ